MTNNTNDNIKNQTAQAQSNKERPIRPLLSLEDDMSEDGGEGWCDFSYARSS